MHAAASCARCCHLPRCAPHPALHRAPSPVAPAPARCAPCPRFCELCPIARPRRGAAGVLLRCCQRNHSIPEGHVRCRPCVRRDARP
jgi:hypothetical protein